MSQGWTTHTRCEEGSSLILETVPFAAGTAPRPLVKLIFECGHCPSWAETGHWTVSAFGRKQTLR